MATDSEVTLYNELESLYAAEKFLACVRKGKDILATADENFDVMLRIKTNILIAVSSEDLYEAEVSTHSSSY
jgi:hypothetical protein